MTQVSLSTSTNFDGELNALIEDQGTELTFRFDLDEPAPKNGLRVFVDSNIEQMVNRLDLPTFLFNPVTENTNIVSFVTDFNNTGLALTIDEGATFASFTIPIFDNPEPDTFLPLTFDGLAKATFSLKTKDEVKPEDQGDIRDISDYTIDPNAAESIVFFADNESQLGGTPNPIPGSEELPLVGLTTGPDFLVESLGTVSAHVFKVTGEPIPENGLVISINAPKLGEFDLDNIEINNKAEIVAIREDGFDLKLNEAITLINLPVAADGEIEGLETTGFSLEPGTEYNVNPDFNGGEFTIVDTSEELPGNNGNPNSTVPIVSISAEPEILIETEETVAVLNLSLNESPPASGIDIVVSSRDLSEFNLEQIEVTGGKINLDKDLRASLETTLAEKATERVPGATIAVSSPLGNWSEATGLADIANNIPVTTSDRFEVGSVTKPFVSATILKLVEAGTLTLEDKLTDWLPAEVTAKVPNSEQITIRQILNHTSGVANYSDPLVQQGTINPELFQRDWQPEELLEFLNGVEPFFAPGESWQYSNTNYILAGMVIEAATGNNVAAEIRANVIQPLNLDNTFFAEEEEIPGGYIKGYFDVNADGVLDDVSVANLSWAWTSGSIVSTTEDLTQFAQALYGGDLLSEASLAEMLTFVDTGQGYSYGLGVTSFETLDLGTVIGHDGGNIGFQANMWYAAEDNFTYVDLINGRANQGQLATIIPLFQEGVISTFGNSAYSELNLTLTGQNAQIRLPVANDGEIEGEETAAFNVEAGAGYQIDPDAQTGSFSVFDLPAINEITGTNRKDNLVGTEGKDLISGLRGRDTLAGLDGDDTLDGGRGADRLMGGNGNDTLDGGRGADRLTGGEGNDSFVFTKLSHKVDRITDFAVGEDSIDVSQILAKPIYGSSTPFVDYISLKQIGSNTHVKVDPNGDRFNLFDRTLVILNDVVSTDLSAEDFLI